MVVPCLCQCGGGMGSGLGNDIVKYIWGHLMLQVGYLVHFRKKVQKLEKDFEHLKHLKNDVQREVEAAHRAGEVIKDVVTAWLKKAGDLEVEVDKLLSEAGENRRCFKGCCIDWAWCYKLGKEARKKVDIIEELQTGGVFERVSQSPPPPGIDSMPVRDFMAFSSTRDAMNKVRDAMKDVNKQLIGIYGMGGVGKTTLMEELGRQFTKDKEFGPIVKVVVSQNPNVTQIRRDIADELGMRLWGDGDPAARALATRLKKEANIVIMLDDVWSRLELREIGIPYGAEHRGCKILFTTRTLQACQLMESHAAVLVDVLTEEDSWTLFKSKVGEIVESPNLEHIARKVARECGGLPLAIVVVGRALRGRNKESIWESALMQLKRSIPTELINVEEQLFKSLELSYNYIKNKEMKLLFLFCCLFREDYEMSEDELTRYAVGEGFLSDAYTLDDARRKVHLLLDDLIACCLLLSTGKDRHVKMHDVVRDVAVYIASKGDDCFFVKAGLGMRDWPEIPNFKVYKRISLMHNDMVTLPDQPYCPQLLTLLLNFNPISGRMTDNFFGGMSSLRVLDLSDTNMESLPPSLASLANLGALRLDRCKNLCDISLIGQLKKLQILGLQKCLAGTLPEEIGTLVNLRLLDLSYSPSLMIPANLMCKLSRLEELFMISNDMSERLFVEIGSLKRLVSLQVYVSDATFFSRDVETIDVWKNINQFSISAASDWSKFSTAYQKNLFLKKARCTANWTKILLGKAEYLILDDCDLNLDNFVNLDEGSSFANLKQLQLVTCHSIESILSTEQSNIPQNAFANLEQLKLWNLENLKIICHGTLPDLSFRKLRVLDVRCKKLSTIIPPHLLQRVNCSLQYLSVNSCDDADEVFNSEGIEEGTAILPQLKTLDLMSLPHLTNIWNGNIPPGSLHKLSAFRVHGVDKLVYLFSQQSGPGQSKQLPQGTFANLTQLEVGRCRCLRYLFLPSLVHELQSLEILVVKNNSAMKEIIGVENSVVLDKSSFPRLKQLSLIDLPMLESFNHGMPELISFDWPSLEYIKVELCPNVRRLPIGPNSAPKLKNVNLGDDDDVEWFHGLVWEDTSILSRLEICNDSVKEKT